MTSKQGMSPLNNDMLPTGWWLRADRVQTGIIFDPDGRYRSHDESQWLCLSQCECWKPESGQEVPLIVQVIRSIQLGYRAVIGREVDVLWSSDRQWVAQVAVLLLQQLLLLLWSEAQSLQTRIDRASLPTSCEWRQLLAVTNDQLLLHGTRSAAGCLLLWHVQVTLCRYMLWSTPCTSHALNCYGEFVIVRRQLTVGLIKNSYSSMDALHYGNF